MQASRQRLIHQRQNHLEVVLRQVHVGDLLRGASQRLDVAQGFNGIEERFFGFLRSVLLSYAPLLDS